MFRGLASRSRSREVTPDFPKREGWAQCDTAPAWSPVLRRFGHERRPATELHHGGPPTPGNRRQCPDAPGRMGERIYGASEGRDADFGGHRDWTGVKSPFPLCPFGTMWGGCPLKLCWSSSWSCCFWVGAGSFIPAVARASEFAPSLRARASRLRCLFHEPSGSPDARWSQILAEVRWRSRAWSERREDERVLRAHLQGEGR